MSVMVATCPVCDDTAGDDEVCARCGWTLRAGPWAGIATSEHLGAFGDRLTDARMRYDLTVAAMAAEGDPVVLGRLLPLLRGGTPGDAEVAAALAAWVPPDVKPVADVVGPVLARFAAATDDPRRTLNVLEFTADGVVVVRLSADAAGTPGLAYPPRTIAWPDLLPGLPSDPDECRYELARVPDALSGLDPARLVPQPAGKGNWIVVLDRMSGWRAVGAAVARFRSVHAVRGPAAVDAIEELIPAAPLRFDHSVVLVDVGESARTKPLRYPLFRAGAVAEETDDVEVEVEAPAGCDRPVVAVVAGPKWMSTRECVPVLVERCALPKGRPVTLRFRLHGPGAVEVSGPAVTTSDPHSRDTWPDLLDDLPATHHRHPDQLDLAVAIERGGSVHEFARRREFAYDLLEHLASHHASPHTVRVAVLGYADHEGPGRARVVSGCALVPIAEATQAVLEMRESVLVEPKAAAVEDALGAAAKLPWSAPRRHLVVIGARPPHPSEYSSIQRCPNGFRAEAQLANLQRSSVRRLAVWDRPDWCAGDTREAKRVARTWRSLGGSGGVTSLVAADVGAIATKTLLVGQETSQGELPFPLVPVSTDLENHR